MSAVERIAYLAVLGGVAIPLGTCHAGDSAPTIVPLQVQFGGCREVYSGPVCVVDEERPLRLWLSPPPRAKVRPRIDGLNVDTRGVPVEGGIQYTLTVPPGAATVSVEGRQGSVRLGWTLKLSHEVEPEGLAAAERLRWDPGQLDAALLALADLADSPDPKIRAAYLGKAARIAKFRGDIQEASRLFREALILDRVSGRIAGEAGDRGAFAHLLVYESRQFEEARNTIAPVRFLATQAPEVLAAGAYTEGLIALDSGDLRGALSAFQTSRVAGLRIGVAGPFRRATLDMTIHALQVVGRHADALELMNALKATDGDALGACERAGLSNNLGWYAMRAAQAGAIPFDLDEPAEQMREAVRILEEECDDAKLLALVHSGLAQLELARHQPEAALAHLEASLRAMPSPTPWLSVQMDLVTAQVALARGASAEALSKFDRALAAAESSGLLVNQREATLGRAQTLEALQRFDDAIAAYDDSDRLLDRIGLAVPLGEGRDAFLAAHDDGARRRIDLLLRLGRTEDAASAARRSRARALAMAEASGRVGKLNAPDRERWYEALAAYREAREALDAEPAADWSLPVDELARRNEARRDKRKRLSDTMDRALAVLGGSGSNGELKLAGPRPGELFLIFHPVNDGWAAFSIDHEETKAIRLGSLSFPMDDEHAARVLLEPFAESLRSAKALRIFGYDEVVEVDFAALPLDGRPLITHLAVTYGTDIDAVPGRERPAGEPSAVVIADPRSDLPAARREAETVARHLEQRGFRVVRLFGEQASHRNVRRAVEDPNTHLLHYAGHGVQAGHDGWQSGLPLADGGWFTVSDVLATPRAPVEVVLSGCDTARTDRAAASEGLGLAQAFLLAGAHTVVAARRPVDDQLASALMVDLYDPAGGPLDLQMALRRAQSKRAALPARQWASFRALTR